MEANPITAAPVPTETEQLKSALDELRAFEKKNLLINRVRMIFSAACLVILIIGLILIAVNVGSVVREVETVSKVVLETGNNVNAVAQDLSKIDFEKLGISLQSIADISEDTLKQVNGAAGGLDRLVQDADEAMQHINSVNFEDLNNGIQRLNDVLEPVANFFKIFK